MAEENMMTTPNQFFQQALDNYNDPTAVPPNPLGTGPSNPLPTPDLSPKFTGPMPEGQAPPDMLAMPDLPGADPATEFIRKMMPEWDTVRGLADSIYPDKKAVPVKTPWQALVLGGLVDGLATISQTQKPQPIYAKRRSGKRILVGYTQPNKVGPLIGTGYLSAMGGTRAYNENMTAKQNRDADQKQSFQRQLATAVVSRAIAEKHAGASTGTSEFERGIASLKESGYLTTAEAQRMLAAKLKKEAGLNEDLWKGSLETQMARLRAKADATEDAEEKASFKHMADLLDNEIKTKNERATESKIAVKKTMSGGSATAGKGGSSSDADLTTDEKRALDEKLKPLQTEESDVRKLLLKKQETNQKMKGMNLSKFVDTKGETELQTRLDKITKQQQEIRDQYMKPTPTKKPAGDGWAIVR